MIRQSYQCDDAEKLIRKQKRRPPKISSTSHIYMFDIMKCVHILTGHGGQDKMIKNLNKYASVTREFLQLYKALCLECEKQRKCATTKGVVKPILSSDFDSRGQVNLIDLQSMAKYSCQWIMVYQDYLTKCCVLKPLTS